MTDITPSNAKIQVEATRTRSAVSESVAQAMGGAINHLFDDRDTTNANLATETANRIAADAGLQGQINTINTRLLNAKNVGLIFSATQFVNADLGLNGTVGIYGRGGYGGDYRFDLLLANGYFQMAIHIYNDILGTISKALAYDTFIANTAGRFCEISWDSTSAQMAFTIQIWDIAAI